MRNGKLKKKKKQLLRAVKVKVEYGNAFGLLRLLLQHDRFEDASTQEQPGAFNLLAVGDCICASTFMFYRR